MLAWWLAGCLLSIQHCVRPQAYLSAEMGTQGSSVQQLMRQSGKAFMHSLSAELAPSSVVHHVQQQEVPQLNWRLRMHRLR